MPNLGKFIFKINNFEIRQLIYKMHRILYSTKEDKIYILVISHTTRNYKEIVNYIKTYFKSNEKS